ncbi:hypothetical protein BpHYR1_032789 [Brachionus plicatilis]|uniref:Uncharacterized protein n=1 Tax=Brachionus plicatilis TaxID=10195 RepID=A0A3M7SSQ2_BRAPC|nr:hypothetical protein BpHYR1_032789 [Brachionus plicatilis]
MTWSYYKILFCLTQNRVKLISEKYYPKFVTKNLSVKKLTRCDIATFCKLDLTPTNYTYAKI